MAHRMLYQWHDESTIEHIPRKQGANFFRWCGFGEDRQV